MSFFSELKRRNVTKVAMFYGIGSWLLLQVGDVLFDALGLPDWSMKLVLGLLALGFVPVLAFSWVYEMTPEGIKKESEINREQSTTPATGRRLNQLTVVMALVVVGMLVYDRVAPPASQLTTPTDVAPMTTNAEASPSPADTAAASAGLSIAVLPFVNMSADADNEYFSDGVSEEILNVLARIPELKVAARTSAFQFKGENLDVGDIGRELKVAHVLEGSVRRAGNRVRVTAQLIKVSDGFHLWSDTYDRELTDIFAIQDDIAQAIATALKTTLKLASAPGGNLTGTANIEAYELYLQGMQQWHLREVASLQRAMTLFEKAIEIDPDFARAYGGLALTYAVYPDYTGEQVDKYEAKTAVAATRALELNPNLVEAFAALASFGSDYDRRFALFEQAIKINPSFATAYQWYGNTKVDVGDLDAGLALLQHAYELDPRSRIIANNLAMTFMTRGELDAALRVVKEAEAYAPNFNENLEVEFLVLLLRGDQEAAQSVGERLALSLGKRAGYTSLYLDLFGNPDQKAAAARQLTGLDLSGRIDPDSPMLLYDFDLAILLAKAGAHAEAMAFSRISFAQFGYVSGWVRTNRAILTHNCRADVQAYYTELGVPPLRVPLPCPTLPVETGQP